MNKKIITGIIAIMCLPFILITFLIKNHNDDKKAIATTQTTQTTSDSDSGYYNPDKYYPEDTEDNDTENEETYKDEDIDDENSDIDDENSEDYMSQYYESEEYKSTFEYKTSPDRLEDKLKEIADEVAIGIPYDYKVTYQYEPENHTGYIMITWLDASSLSKKEQNYLLEAVGVKDALQQLATQTAQELNTIPLSAIDISCCIIFRDMNSRTLYSCYNE